MNILSVLILNALLFFGHAQVELAVPNFSIAVEGTQGIPEFFDLWDIYSVTLDAVVAELDGTTMNVPFATSLPFSALGLEIPFEDVTFTFEDGFIVPTRAELLDLVEDVVSSPDYLVALQEGEGFFNSVTVVTFIAPEDTCFSEPGVGIFGCLCHPSCATCGYFEDPTTKFDCLTCADGSEVIPVFEDGAGYCESIVDPDSSCRLSPEVGLADCECHPSCGTCGYYGNPVLEGDCITCANDSAVNQLFEDGTGTCSTDTVATSEPSPLPTGPPTVAATETPTVTPTAAPMVATTANPTLTPTVRSRRFECPLVWSIEEVARADELCAAQMDFVPLSARQNDCHYFCSEGNYLTSLDFGGSGGIGCSTPLNETIIGCLNSDLAPTMSPAPTTAQRADRLLCPFVDEVEDELAVLEGNCPQLMEVIPAEEIETNDCHYFCGDRYITSYTFEQTNIGLGFCSEDEAQVWGCVNADLGRTVSSPPGTTTKAPVPEPTSVPTISPTAAPEISNTAAPEVSSSAAPESLPTSAPQSSPTAAPDDSMAARFNSSMLGAVAAAICSLVVLG